VIMGWAARTTRGSRASVRNRKGVRNFARGRHTIGSSLSAIRWTRKFVNAVHLPLIIADLAQDDSTRRPTSSRAIAPFFLIFWNVRVESVEIPHFGGYSTATPRFAVVPNQQPGFGSELQFGREPLS
jgi:hypothetical protein